MLHPLFPSALAFLLLWVCEIISLAMGGLQGFALISAGISLFGLLSVFLWLSLSFEGLFLILKIRFKTFFDLSMIDRFALIIALIVLGAGQVFALEKIVIFFHPKFRQVTYLGLSVALSTIGLNLISLFVFKLLFQLFSSVLNRLNWLFEKLIHLVASKTSLSLAIFSPFSKSGFFLFLLISGIWGIDFLQNEFEQFHTLDFRAIQLCAIWLYTWLLIKSYQQNIQNHLLEIKALMLLSPKHILSKFYFLFISRFWVIFFLLLSLYGLWVCALINDRLSIALQRDTRIATFILSGLQWATDQDGDGVSHLFGQKDCQPHARHIAPNVHEINQDLNCNGQVFQIQQNPLENQNQAFDRFKKTLPLAFDQNQNAFDQSQKRPNVILLTIDALRYDLAMKNMPKLKAFAKQNLSFQNAYSHAPATYWSLPALLTSKMPSTIEMANDQTPQNTELLLTEMLSAQQYHTALFANVTVFFVRGLRQGMFVSDYQTSDYTIHGAKPGSEHLRLGMTRYIDDFLAKRIQPKRDQFFLWGHFYDPHDPYFDVPNYPAQGKDDLSKYGAILRWTDDQIAIFIEDLKKKGVLDQSILIITADHGEEFLDHQHRHHGKTLYEEMIKVPLILSVPQWQAHNLQPKILDLPIGHRQILPTLLDFLKIPAPVGPLYARQSLYPLLTHPERLDTSTFNPMLSVFFEALADQNYHQNLVGVRNQQHKIIYHMNDGTFEYYDLQKDPLEKYNDFEEIEKSTDLKQLKVQLMQYVDFQRYQQWLKKAKK
jgi:arylsulfatase A-like enzyme